MKITKQWLCEQNACESGIDWFLKQRASKLETTVMKLLKENHFDWANWVLVRFMSHTQKVTYAVFAAKQVLHLFEEKYPNDKRPWEAIEAVLRFVDNPTLENQDAANAAANAANAAAYAAANAAYAAANTAAYAAANAANAAAYAAANAAYAAATTAYVVTGYVADGVMKRKIIVYGLKLLNKEEKRKTNVL